MPNVIACDGNGTVIKPPLAVTNHAIINMLRFMFTMTTLMKREFGIASTETAPLYRRFVIIRNRLGRVRNAFPATLKGRRKEKL